MDNPWVIDHATILIRLSLAVFLGGLIGFEREQQNHPAGLRTHILVCLGSSMIMLLSIYGFAEFAGEPNVRIDPARLATAVITGVGFLGAGTILFTGKSITGLTTAASLWVVAAIGLQIGAGFYFSAAAGTILVFITLWVFNKVEHRFLKSKKVRKLTIQAETEEELLDIVTQRLASRSIMTQKMMLQRIRPSLDMPLCWEVKLDIVVPRTMEPKEIVAEMKQIGGVVAVSFE
ncbi:magnesium transporter MgtC [Paenibacillus sp. FSL A5-0031]|uniref:MgtC/SapB family protein n=1 Tax=unclassified Paenibacillus TaxID=185978 RepID=UPI00096FBBF0|nr:MgtC/SapB family protein [Paenibacillus sp. FSL A5-0031]OME76958.1 magnesium transporter MgtC [Paenibacillus sp. FSL A5-0031]